jgi:hypothetical protein
MNGDVCVEGVPACSNMMGATAQDMVALLQEFCGDGLWCTVGLFESAGAAWGGGSPAKLPPVGARARNGRGARQGGRATLLRQFV